MEIGDTIKAGGVEGVIVEIHATDSEKQVKVRTNEGSLAIITYYVAKTNGLGEMRLG
jgi:tRNA G18 (ribose-2'-O)-methylase SpoU